MAAARRRPHKLEPRVPDDGVTQAYEMSLTCRMRPCCAERRVSAPPSARRRHTHARRTYLSIYRLMRSAVVTALGAPDRPMSPGRNVTGVVREAGLAETNWCGPE